ncbi:RagB/SusD family nutrient uptake outer membrane protein [Pedobacter jeongneungensis]|uniref:RagB/SusD family nutrient uptake outer membrane protein n=1 Tax=Pedobacter jeongneungensis TaxID=947309 RepID=UPI0004683829|nr:RagB/SusD family nutrient uptake outer membrane protein [Pedobacter jeongneungensis]
MKRYLKYIALICLLISVLSCKKGFLEESSQDLVRPTTTAALNQLMTGEAYPLNNVITDFTELLTDDVQSEYNANATVVSALNKYAPAFTWQKNMIDRLVENTATNSNIWYNYYARIKGCNVVLDYVDQVNGTESEKQNLRGQALALRSFYYLMMVNYFGKPYYGANANPETDLGVPLILTAAVTDQPVGRSTVKEVYSQIEKDLLEAIPLLDANGTGNHIYKFNGTSARFLLSRIYLYMGNWDACIRYADATLQKKSSLKQMNEIATATFGISSAVSSPEVIWGYGFNAELSIMPFGGGQSVAKAAYFVSDDLGNSYANSDLRLKYSFTSIVYLTTTINTYKGRSAKFVAGNTNGKAFRTAEAYLNRAEAYIQKALAGDASAVSKALADINLLRLNRITTSAYVPVTITDPQELYTFYKAERRRELCLEDSRWFDLRRWGMPELKHNFQLTSGSSQVETLQKNDARYTLAIPTEALSRNPNLIQNP